MCLFKYRSKVGIDRQMLKCVLTIISCQDQKIITTSTNCLDANFKIVGLSLVIKYYNDSTDAIPKNPYKAYGGANIRSKYFVGWSFQNWEWTKATLFTNLFS